MKIDHINNIELSEEDTERFYHERNLQKTLAAGLDFLNYQVVKIEEEVRSRLNAKE